MYYPHTECIRSIPTLVWLITDCEFQEIQAKLNIVKGIFPQDPSCLNEKSKLNQSTKNVCICTYRMHVCTICGIDLPTSGYDTLDWPGTKTHYYGHVYGFFKQKC